MHVTVHLTGYDGVAWPVQVTVFIGVGAPADVVVNTISAMFRFWYTFTRIMNPNSQEQCSLYHTARV